MLFIKLFSLGLILHDLTYFAKDGKQYFIFNSCPTFGFKFTSIQLIIIHACFLLADLSLIFLPKTEFFICQILLFIQLITLTAIVISFPLRLSNHLIIAWFVSFGLFCTILLDQTIYSNNFIIYIQYLVVIIYSISAFHKLNYDYFDLKKSCAYNLSKLYAQHIGIKNKYFVQALDYFSVFGIIIIEATIPILIISNMGSIGIVMALFIHLCLGWLCHMHFSAIMYSLLICFIQEHIFILATKSLVISEWILIIGLGIIGGMYMGAIEIFSLKRFSRFLQIIFSIYSLYFIYIVSKLPNSVNNLQGNHLNFQQHTGESQIILITLIIIFSINCICPYLGIKSEFSLNMFSNLRDDNWKHFIVPENTRLFYKDPFCIIKSIEIWVDEKFIDNVDTEVISAIELLNNFETLKFSKYFIYSTFRRISENTYMNFSFTIDKVDGHDLIIKDMSGLKKIKPKILGNFYPFAISINSNEPHCR